MTRVFSPDSTDGPRAGLHHRMLLHPCSLSRWLLTYSFKTLFALNGNLMIQVSRFLDLKFYTATAYRIYLYENAPMQTMKLINY